MSRLFTFGCSFTRYHWPTWADILGKNFNTYQNWGQSGGGNQYISHSVVECDLKNNLTKDDTVIIMWTNVAREDRYLNGAWLNYGNIYNSQSKNTYVKDLVKYADIRGYYIRDLALMHLTQRLLENTGCRYIFLSMVDIANVGQFEFTDCNDKILDLITYYKPLLDQIRPSVHRTVFNNDWSSRPLEGLTLDVITQSIRNQVWASWYNNIKDLSWPECPTDAEFAKLPKYIQEECITNFDYKKIIDSLNTNHKLPNKGFMLKRHLEKRFDAHPIPDEHLEYVEKVLPEFDVDPDIKHWINNISTMILSNKDYSKLWQAGTNDPIRW
jgi:hypothetical protein